MLMNPNIQSITREDGALARSAENELWQHMVSLLRWRLAHIVHAWLGEPHTHAEIHASPPPPK